MEVGDRLSLAGRLQSRRYNKEVDGQLQERTAFEVSVMSLAPAEDNFSHEVDNIFSCEYDGDNDLIQKG